MTARVLKLLMDSDRSAPENQTTPRDLARFVGILRDAMILGMLALIGWTVSELHTLSNDVTGLKANHVTQEQTSALERHFSEMISNVQAQQVEATRSVLGQLTTISNELGKIGGRLEARETRDSERHR